VTVAGVAGLKQSFHSPGLHLMAAGLCAIVAENVVAAGAAAAAAIQRPSAVAAEGDDPNVLQQQQHGSSEADHAAAVDHSDVQPVPAALKQHCCAATSCQNATQPAAQASGRSA